MTMCASGSRPKTYSPGSSSCRTSSSWPRRTMTSNEGPLMCEGRRLQPVVCYSAEAAGYWQTITRRPCSSRDIGQLAARFDAFFLPLFPVDEECYTLTVRYWITSLLLGFVLEITAFADTRAPRPRSTPAPDP